MSNLTRCPTTDPTGVIEDGGDTPNWGPQVDARQYREGTLSIDLFDAHSHRPVWHGWAKKQLTKADMERSEAAIQEAVDKVLAQFPPG